MTTGPVRSVRGALTVLLAGAAAMSLVGCAGQDDPPPRPTASGSSTAARASSHGVLTSSTTTSTSTTGTPSRGPDVQGDSMRITISVDDQRFQATLSDSAASRDLVAQLPLTIDMADHGSVEKTGALPAPLSLDGQPEGADPDVGDVGYYAPGNDLVLYYGDQAFFPGIVILGRLEGDAAVRLAQLDGSVTVTVESAE